MKNREYNLVLERTLTIPYSIDREDALNLIQEEWNDEIAELCKNDNKMLDKYMKEYAKRVSEGGECVDIGEHFIEHDWEFQGDITWAELDAKDTTDNGYIDGTHEVLWGTDYEEDEEDGK